jgi:hypothetical protein
MRSFPVSIPSGLLAQGSSALAIVARSAPTRCANPGWPRDLSSFLYPAAGAPPTDGGRPEALFSARRSGQTVATDDDRHIGRVHGTVDTTKEIYHDHFKLHPS